MSKDRIKKNHKFELRHKKITKKKAEKLLKIMILKRRLKGHLKLQKIKII